jgi:DNA-binding MurR/RpiR family transcriptional regulator
LKTHQQLENKRKAVSEDERNILKTAIKALEEQRDEMAKKIAEEAGRRYPAYKRLVEELGIDGNTTAREALAELMPYLVYPMGYIKLCNLLGLFKPIRGKKKIYSGHLRKALQRLTASTNNIPPYQLTAKLEKETLAKIWKTYRQETLGRLAIPAQG